jgi:hypothetical protein
MYTGLSGWTEHFGIYLHKTPINASKFSLHCDAWSHAPTCFGAPTPPSGGSHDPHKLLVRVHYRNILEYQVK